MDEVKRVWLKYDDGSYAGRYVVYEDGRLFRVLKSKCRVGVDKGRTNIKLVPKHPTPDGYGRWHVKHPQLGWRWITASRAVQLSFNDYGIFAKFLVAAHNCRTKRSDCALRDCMMTSQRVNCFQKRRDGTHRTSGTRPGKLKGKDDRVLELYNRWGSIRAVAGIMDVARRSIRLRLKKLGRIP